MKNIQNFEHTIHTRIESLLRHRLILVSVLGLFGLALVKYDMSNNHILQQAYNQGFGWVGTYMHHEHPTHNGLSIMVSRTPTISGSS